MCTWVCDKLPLSNVNKQTDFKHFDSAQRHLIYMEKRLDFVYLVENASDIFSEALVATSSSSKTAAVNMNLGCFSHSVNPDLDQIVFHQGRINPESC